MSKFKRLKLSDDWKAYLIRYPRGYTILENLIDWLSQTNKLIENVNDWNEYLDDFVENFDRKLEPTVINTLYEMADDGTLDRIINENIFNDLNDRIDGVAIDFENFKEDMNQNFADLNDEVEQNLTHFKAEVQDTLENSLKSRFNVLQYGAKLDGVTDDTEAFQLCANAIADNGGGIFEIPYVDNPIIIGGTVNMPSNVILEGNNNTILAESSDNSDTPFYWADSSNVAVKNITIDGRKELKDSQQSVGGGSNGLTFRGECTNIRVENSKFYNTLEHGISFMGRVYTNPTRVARSTDVVITGCVFERNGNPYWTAGPRGAGVMLYYGVRNIKITNNIFKNFIQTGIYVDSAYGSKEEMESLYPELPVNEGHYAGRDVVISNNEFTTTVNFWTGETSQSGAGIKVHGQQRVTIANNIINLPIGRYRGIHVDDGQERTPTHDITINGNWIVTTQQAVMVVDCSQVMVTNNKIESTRDNVVVVEAQHSPTSTIIITSNNIRGRGSQGIRVHNRDSDNLSLFAVVVNDNVVRIIGDEPEGSSGFRLVGSADDIKISNNRFINGYYGIYVPSDALNTYIDNNTISSIEGYAIYITTSYGVVRFNTIRNSTNDIYNPNGSISEYNLLSND